MKRNQLVFTRFRRLEKQTDNDAWKRQSGLGDLGEKWDRGGVGGMLSL